MQTAALVLGAGRGERLGHSLPKAFVPLAGRTLLERSLEVFCTHPRIDGVFPVIPKAEFARYAELGIEDAVLQPPVAGGAERQDSVRCGLEALGEGFDFVLVHDAARCLVTPAEIDAVWEAAVAHGAALLARPARDTIKRVRDGAVVETPPRAECFAAQTPQAFRVSLLREAFAKADAEGRLGTDDAELVEALGARVVVALGSAENLKITEAHDLPLAEALLRARAGSA